MLFISSSFLYLCYVAFLGRLVHLTVGIYLLVKINSENNPLHKMMNNWMRANNKIFSAITLLVLIDVTMIPYLPWLDRTFVSNTKGFPTKKVFLMCVYSKILQTLLITACQAVYFKHVLEVASTLPSIPTSVAFLAVNIAITGLVLILNVVDAANKTSLLREWEEEDKRKQQTLENRLISGTNPIHSKRQSFERHAAEVAGEVEMSPSHYRAYPSEDTSGALSRLSLEHSTSRSKDRHSQGSRRSQGSHHTSSEAHVLDQIQTKQYSPQPHAPELPPPVAMNDGFFPPLQQVSSPRMSVLLSQQQHLQHQQQLMSTQRPTTLRLPYRASALTGVPSPPARLHLANSSRSLSPLKPLELHLVHHPGGQQHQ